MRKNRGISTTIAAVVIIIALIVGIAGGYFLAPTKTSTVTQPVLSGVINIGAALPLSGDLATYGQNAKLALDLATNQINTLLNASNAGYTIHMIYEDTVTDPAKALTATQDLYTKGCQVILGYYSSGELRNCMSYAQTNHIVLISPSSTATSLEIDKPYIYRFVPPDDKQGPAMARGLVSQGIKYIVPIWRGDTYGDGLVNATETRFVALNGSYDSNGIRYDPKTSDFAAQASVLATEIQNAVNTYSADKVAVYAVTFEEITALMHAALQYPILSQVKWFGCDGSAQSGAVIADSVVANFCIQTQFPATYFAPTKSSIQTTVINYVRSFTGHAPDPYAFGSYDSLWVVAKCIGLSQQYTGASINRLIPTVANMTFGALGQSGLDSHGDLIGGDYNFWQVYKVNSTTFDWYTAGFYSAAADSVTWFPVP